MPIRGVYAVYIVYAIRQGLLRVGRTDRTPDAVGITRIPSG